MKSKLFILLAVWLCATKVPAQSSIFTYQGQLQTSGSPAGGTFDFRFTLYDAVTAGNAVSSTLTNVGVVLSNGVFTTALDFGGVVLDGSARWLEIGVRTNAATNGFVTLAPRQALTAAPYAFRAANLTGTFAASNLSGTLPDARLSTNVALLTNNVIFTRTVTASNFTGSGFGLVNIPATSLTGTIPDARLSTNVAFLNSNAIFAGSLTATQFNGNGVGLTNVPGRIFQVYPIATNTTALANTGYLATNDAVAVVVTLPATANIRIGETVRVSGSGAGGWIVAQNANQSILMANLLDAVGVAWRTNESSRSWKAIASSADGAELVAAVAGGNIYTSTNYGVNWTARASAQNWSAVASSGDGTKLVGVVNGGLIYVSTDSGASWINRDANRAWTSVASSLDGVKLVATANGGQIYTSENSGVNWSPHGGNANWTAVACSANGSNMVATATGGALYTSTNGGISWTSRTQNRNWTSVASSADGSRLLAGVGSGSPDDTLYLSWDFGVTWFPVGPTPLTWTAVACSADGARMIAAADSASVYVSQDSGVSWAQRPNLPTTGFYKGVAASSDGSTLAVVGSSQAIFISSQAATTAGTAGQLIGSRLSAVELQHIGNGVFMPISSVGVIRAR